MKPIDIAAARNALDYDPETGVFRWKISNRGHRKAGDVAGSRVGRGTYRRVKINQQEYAAHRLAWAMMYGEDPGDEIDHINGDPSDNRIANLRPATRQQNCQNIGAAGVRFEPDRQRWLARICVNGRQKNLGRYLARDDAERAYRAAASLHFGEFARSHAVRLEEP